MNIQEFKQILLQKAAELNDFRHRKLPVLVGRTAKDHFQENFRQGGFVDGSLHPWQEVQRRKKGGKRASAKYGTLLSGRNHLFSSIKYIPGDSSVTVTNDVEYAALHNNGGQITTHPQVTPKMRKFAWAQYYQAAGITKRMKAGGKKRKAIEENLPEEALKWKRLALTTKETLDGKASIPKRQFIGESRELNQKIENLIETNITNILNK